MNLDLIRSLLRTPTTVQQKRLIVCGALGSMKNRSLAPDASASFRFSGFHHSLVNRLRSVLPVFLFNAFSMTSVIKSHIAK